MPTSRALLSVSLFLLFAICNIDELHAADSTGPFLAMGIKSGEVTPTSAIVWARLTQNEKPNREGFDFRGSASKNKSKPKDVSELWGACPGTPGRMRIRYAKNADLVGGITTDWVDVTKGTDFTNQVELKNLLSATTYFYVVEVTSPGESEPTASLFGRFATAPKKDAVVPVRFNVLTGLGYRDMEHDNGYGIFNSMYQSPPDFTVYTGDTVYYDSDWPKTTNVNIAHYHWQRFTSMSRHIKLNRRVPSYWMKDDHDVFANDCWSTLRVKAVEPFAFKDGQRIFHEENPMSSKTYRTFRWGKELQVWMLESRDYRKPNDMPDGPEKTLLGKEQKAWFKKTLAESDAVWKVVISPTPIVGPPRKGKFDNHASAFVQEGKELREWMSKHGRDNTFVLCGDIHYQYHSLDPNTWLNEFSCGPASDGHSGGFSGKNRDYHKFTKVQGGYLSVSVEPTDKKSKIAFRFHDTKGKVSYTFKKAILRE